MNSMEQDDQNNIRNEGEEPYSFIEEHVRKRPVDRRRFLWGALRLLLSAIVFGTVAGFVFVLITGGIGLSNVRGGVALRTESPERPESDGSGEMARTPTPTPLSIENGRDEAEDTKTPAVTSPTEKAGTAGEASASPAPDSETAAAGSKASGFRGENSGKKASRLTPTPTAEELEREAIHIYERFQSALRRIFEENLCHRVLVTSNGGKKEGVFGASDDPQKMVGLILGEDSRRLFILLDHLPEGEKHQVTFSDSAQAPAKVYASDPLTGLTILAVQLRDVDDLTLTVCTPAELGNSYGIHPGNLVLVIGTVLGEEGGYLQGSILSAERPYEVPDREYRLLDTDIHSAEDASGFLLDMQGRVVGIFSDRFKPEGTDLISAIPISMVKILLTNMINRKKLVSLGVMGRDISVEEAENLDLPVGIYVVDSLEESAALEAGIRTGDVITEINGKEVTSVLLLEEELYRHEPGDSLTVTLMRPGSEGYEEVTCEAILGPLEINE